MRIQGFQKVTLLDYPGKVACTIFTAGCNLRCPFCHNADLVTHIDAGADIDTEEIFSYINKRKAILDGVVLTGGEPLLQPDAVDFLCRLKETGLAVKLDTNGTNPEMLASLLQAGALDYVAMDIKNSPARYAQTCGGIDMLPQVKKSAALLMRGTVEYEFRTTVCAPLHTPGDMEEIGRWLQGASRYFLQSFVDSGALVGTGMKPLSQEELHALRDSVLPYIPNTKIRE